MQLDWAIHRFKKQALDTVWIYKFLVWAAV